MDGKFSLNDRLILPRLAVHSQNFIFDLQRFDGSDPDPDSDPGSGGEGGSSEGGGENNNAPTWGSATQETTSVFSATVNGVTRYGKTSDFTTEKLGNATAITLLDSFQAPATANTVSATVAPSVGLMLSNSCTLDLNGKTLTFASNIGIRVDSSDENGATANILTVKDSGTGGKIDHTWESNTSSGNAISASNISSTSSSDDKKKAANVVSAIKGNREFSAIKLGYSSTTKDGTGVNTNNKNGVGLTLLGGTIESKSSAVCAGNHSTIVINGGTLESSQSCGVYFGNVAPTEEGMHSSLTMTNGTIRSGENSQLPAIQVSGSMSEQFNNTKETDATQYKNSTVTLDISGGTIEFTHAQDSLAKALDKNNQIDENKYAGNPEAIYAGSNTKLIVSGSAKITSTVTGVELRAGDLEVSGGTISTSATEYTTADKDSGTSGGTTYGAAIAISQHVSNQPIDVKVSGGTIEGANALAVSNTRGENATDAEKKGKVTATIDGGTLRSKASSSSTDKASASGNAILSDKANVVITVNGGNLQGDVTVTKNSTTGIETKATVVVAGGTTTGKVQVVNVTTTTEGGSTTETEAVVDPEDSTLSDAEKTAIKESLNVVGGKITNTESANKYVNAGYTYTSEGVKEDTTNYTRGWAAVEGKDNEFRYSLMPTDGTPTVLAAATVGSGVTDTTGFKYDSTNFLFGIPNLNNVSLEANAANTYKVVGYSIGTGGAASITPFSKGVKITSLAGGLLNNTITKLTINDASATSVYGAYVDATENNLSYMKGGKGQNTLIAGARNTTLETGDNADTLVGGDNTDTFIYTAGKGVIENYEYGTDIASISGSNAPPVDFDNAYFDGNKFVFKFDDSKTLHFRGSSQVQLLHTADNTTNTYTYNENSSIAKEGSGISLGAGFTAKSYDGSDKGYGTIDAHWVTGSLKISAKDDTAGGTVIGAQGGGTLLGGTGSDLLQSSVTAADSKLTLDGGAYGNDSLVGNQNADNLFIYRGGADSIRGLDASKDIVRLMGNDYAPGKASVLTDDNNNLILNFEGNDAISISGGANFDKAVSVQSGTRNAYYRFSKDQISYDKGVTLTSYYDTKIESTDKKYFDGAAEGNTNYATINAAANSAISIVGNTNNNYIVGGLSGGNSLDGGTTGNDTLVGGTSGNDFFYYKGGKDVIENFNAASDSISNDNISGITSAKATSSKLTFTINKKSDELTFNFGDGDAIEKVSLEGGGYLTKDGKVNSNALTLFSSAKKTIDIANDTLYTGANIETVDATKVAKQGVTLVGGSGGLYKFNGSNKQKDGFTYGGGSASISGYEGGRDRIDFGTYSYNGFSISGTDDVVLNLKSGDTTGSISIDGAAGEEILLRENNKNSKLVFKADGVLENKAKNPTMATVSAAHDFTGDDKTVKKIFVVGGDTTTGILIKAGDRNNTILNASVAGGVSLSGGSKNDKLIGASGKADTFIYSAGKDVIQGFGSEDKISISGTADVATFNKKITDAKITKSNSNIKFKFNNKDTLTVKAEKGTTFTNGQLQINGKTYTYLKNAVQDGGTVSLTSSFGGTFKTTDATQQTIDGGLVKNNLTFVGSTRDEKFIGSNENKKTTFKGGGGNDTLVGGASKDTFFYAKSYTGDAVIQSFDFKNDKLKVASGKIGNISKEGNNITIGMTNGQKNSSAIVGSFKITSGASDTSTFSADKVAFKANNTYYWFASDKDVSSYVSADDDAAITVGQLITTENRLSALPTDLSSASASVIDLNYSTNLAKSGVAIKVKEKTST